MQPLCLGSSHTVPHVDTASLKSSLSRDRAWIKSHSSLSPSPSTVTSTAAQYFIWSGLKMHNAHPVRFTELHLEGVRHCPVKTVGLCWGLWGARAPESRPPCRGCREASQLQHVPALSFSALFQATGPFAGCHTLTPVC